MTIRPLAGALLAASALAIAACGDGAAAPAASTASEDDKMRQAQVKFAQCMRAQGVDVPDPGAGGGPVRIGGDIAPEKFEQAAEACDKYREDIRPQLTEAQQQEFKERALEHARCMREHGIDFPDPTFSADGGAEIRLGPGKLDPEDPEFQAAEKECGGGLMERRP